MHRIDRRAFGNPQVHICIWRAEHCIPDCQHDKRDQEKTSIMVYPGFFSHNSLLLFQLFDAQ